MLHADHLVLTREAEAGELRVQSQPRLRRQRVSQNGRKAKRFYDIEDVPAKAKRVLIFRGHWGLNLGPLACKVGALLLEPRPQCVGKDLFLGLGLLGPSRAVGFDEMENVLRTQKSLSHSTPSSRH